jgi:hypothetical protein
MRASARLVALASLGSALALALPARADDELKFDWTAKIQTDLRFRVAPLSLGDYYNQMSAPAGVERNQNLLAVRAAAKYGRFGAVADMQFVINGYSGTLNGITDLENVAETQPYYLDVNGLYVEGKDLVVRGLDLRIGQQIVSWGVGDQFNPTNNLNPDDLRDPLLFGKQVGNFMVKADYWINDDWSLSGVLVPIFKPALLPPTAPFGIAAIDRLPMLDPEIRHRIEAESAFGTSQGYPAVVSSATPTMPDPTFANMQFAFRVAGTLAGQDIALSYYNGRTDFPQPVSNQTEQSMTPVCAPQGSPCTNGLLNTAVTLAYPKMQVIGLNATGEIPLSKIRQSFHGMGYRLEGALIFPEAQSIALYNGVVTLGGLMQPSGEYDYQGNGVPGGTRPLVVQSTPFAKWVVGLDYAFGDHVYVNAQWVHGLLDEYGAGDFLHTGPSGYMVRESGVTTSATDTASLCVIYKNGDPCAREVLRRREGDYAVLGVDLKFLGNKALLRLFGIVDVTGYVVDEYDMNSQQRVQTVLSPFSSGGYSVVVYPDFNYNFGNGFELGAGALIQLGESYTKFGDPAAGGTVVFTRARFSLGGSATR